MKGDLTWTRLAEIAKDPYSATADEIRWLVHQCGDPEMRLKVGTPKPRVEVRWLPNPAGEPVHNERPGSTCPVCGGAVKARDTSLADIDLEVIAGWTGLRRLVLTHTSISDDGMRLLAKCPELNFLSLKGCEISERALEPLGSMTQLRRLFLTNTPITDIGALADLTDLTALALANSKMTDEGLAAVANFRRLTMITLTNTAITSRSLPLFAGMEHLTSMALGGTGIECHATIPDASDLRCPWLQLSAQDCVLEFRGALRRDEERVRLGLRHHSLPRRVTG